MKNFVTFVLILSAAISLHSQSMRWVPVPAGQSNGKCYCDASEKNQYRCYALEYTPNVTGTLTSYTTGFLVSCTSLGSSIKQNISCNMVNNAKVTDLCSQLGSVLLNSSGNTGSSTDAKVEAGKPVLLHQICLFIPPGESVNITEETITDLTTSINLTGGGAVTEYPSFEPFTITAPRYDASKPTAWLDFKAEKAGDHVSQLDWTVTNETENSMYYVDRSLDGVKFDNIGHVNVIETPGRFHSYQFKDENASVGKNYYRVRLATRWGQVDDSPVRWVTFEKPSFAISVSPNPVSDDLTINVSGITRDYT
ncbi:MAG TPA: hypothetical protein VJ508_08780, partial [Saprospiraceae bacterium]|nr:hypothetical protein [Saprospiraceae bacterium]